MLLEVMQFIKLEKFLCFFRYTLVFITLFTLEKQIYLNEPFFSRIVVICIVFAIWSAFIYIISKKLGNTFKNQYILGIIEWIMDLFFINCFALVLGYYGDGFLYLFMILTIIVGFIRYGISLIFFVFDLMVIGNAYFIYSIIYRHSYALKNQNIIMAIGSMLFVVGICVYIGRNFAILKEKLHRIEMKNQFLTQSHEASENLYRLVTHIYQSTSIDIIITRLLQSIYDIIKEPNIGVILYGEDGIENNAKMYNYYDKEKGRSIYAQREIEIIREHQAYKNCILNHEPIILENMPESLEFIRELLLGKEEKYIYLFNLSKNNKESGLIFISVKKRLETLHCKYIEEIVYHTGLTMFRTEKLEKERSKVVFDQLTGAKTRHYMVERLPHYVSLTHREKCQLGVMFIDIDHFKHFNDFYGHATGDLVLKKVSQVMHSILPKESLIVRYGGEEFLAIVSQTNSEKVYELGNHLRLAVQACSLQDITSDESTITVSIGIAMYPTDGRSIDEVIKRADEAMYKVKQTTRNNVCLYEYMKEER